MNTWIFGYGSLIWRPGFEYKDRVKARLSGWKRRFWQGSHDHRGTPEAPGRVVTLIPDAQTFCDGVAYLIDQDVIIRTFEHLDHREKNGYDRFEVHLETDDGRMLPGVVYIAAMDNFAYLGEASEEHIARHVLTSSGPSGHNTEYVFELAKALSRWNICDPHVDLIAHHLTLLDETPRT